MRQSVGDLFMKGFVAFMVLFLLWIVFGPKRTPSEADIARAEEVKREEARQCVENLTKTSPYLPPGLREHVAAAKIECNKN